ncbi:MAG TPA: hypothetical protein VFD06_13660 [Candidatus Polarisedimenticolia bacterium]|nr:hypothetical protein [Candidatus Polarisedimenticolia bacterium]
MSRFVWVGVLLTVLLAQAAPAASCLTGQAPSMPCCKPGSDCAADGLNVPSCCGLDAPVDRQEDADRHHGASVPSPDRNAVMVPNAPAADIVVLCGSCEAAGSPPRDPGIPIYLRLGALLR